MNAPENFELFNLPEGKKKIDFIKDSKINDSGIFLILLEDHTLGNIIKMQLLRDPRIRYAGYRKPHPLENKIEIKIQTNGEVPPYVALKDAIRSLMEDIDFSTKKFNEEVKKFRPDRTQKNY